MDEIKSIRWDERLVPIEGELKLIGWRNFLGKRGERGKFHAFLLNHPRNHYDRYDDDILISDACGHGWAYYTENNELLSFETNPPIDKCCKNCIRELKKYGLF